MSKGIDWSKAPEGTTHKNIANFGLWYKFNFKNDTAAYCPEGESQWVYSGKASDYNDGSMASMVARPVGTEKERISNIPEGATHTYKGIGAGYRRLNSDGTWDAWDAVDHWVAVSVPRPDLYQPIAAQPWNGEGLPPVGTVCEIRGTVGQELRKQDFNWTEVEIIAHTSFGGAPIAVGRDLRGATLGWGIATSFRPIRTAEQIDAEEREVEINLMTSKCPNPGCDIVRAVCSAIYDAGYRKFEIVEEDDNA